MGRPNRWRRRASWLATIHVAIFGDRHISLPADWSKETVVGIFGDADVDATATAGPEASLTIVSVFADTTIRVPAGTRVRHRGLSIFGDRYLQMSPGAGPQLTLTSYGIFSDVEVIEAPSDTSEGRSSPTHRTEPARESV